MGRPIFNLADLKGATLQTQRRYPGLPEPDGDCKPYVATLSKECPRATLHVKGVPFVKERWAPFKDDGPDRQIPNIVYLADNQVVALNAARRKKAILVQVDTGQVDEISGEKVYARALAPVANWCRLAVHIPTPPAVEGWDDDEPIAGEVAHAVPATEAGEAPVKAQLACEHCDYETPIGSGNPGAALAAHQRQKHREAVAK